MALGEQRLGEIVVPVGFGAFDLNQIGAQQVRGGLRFATLENVGQIVDAFIDFFLVARVAAEQEIVEIQAVKHNLQAYICNGIDALQRSGGFRASVALAQAGEGVDQEQADQNHQNQAESPIKFLADTHC